MINFLDFLKKRRKLHGIKATIDPVYNQKHLEQAVHEMPIGDGFDYCFVWCLCKYYAYYHRRDWKDIAAGVKRVDIRSFDKVTGYVKSISGFTKKLSSFLYVPYYLERVATINADSSPDPLKDLNRVVNALSLKSFFWFVMARWSPEHYTFVSPDGVQHQPFPGYSGRFYGWRLYKAVQRSIRGGREV